jgi:hypothetical protein
MTIEAGFEVLLEELRRQEQAVGRDRMDRLEGKLHMLETKIDSLGHILTDVHDMLRIDISDEVDRRMELLRDEGMSAERTESVPPAGSAPVPPVSNSPVTAMDSAVDPPLDNTGPASNADGPATSSQAASSILPALPVPVPHPVPDQESSRPTAVPQEVVRLESVPLESSVVPLADALPPAPNVSIPQSPYVLLADLNDVLFQNPEVTPISVDPEVRPGVTLISPTPVNSQDLLQPSTQVLLPQAPLPVNAPLDPVIPPPSRQTNTEKLLTVPPGVVEPDPGSPSLRRSPRALSPSPAPSNSGTSGEKKRKDGPGGPAGSQAKKTRR